MQVKAALALHRSVFRSGGGVNAVSFPHINTFRSPCTSIISTDATCCLLFKQDEERAAAYEKAKESVPTQVTVQTRDGEHRESHE